MPPTPRRAGALGGRDSQRHAMQPRRYRAATADRLRPDRQNQESCLEGVLDLVPIAEHAPADVQHHRAVSNQKRRECSLGGLVAFAPA
jgi:hypothetical protein